MAVKFSGTSTDRMYTVGAVYSTGAYTYQAQSDGSFKNLDTGRTVPGSRDDPGTVWVNTGSVGGSQSGGGPVPTVTQGPATQTVVVQPSVLDRKVGNDVQTTGPGSSGVVTVVSTTPAQGDGKGWGEPLVSAKGVSAPAVSGPEKATRLWYKGSELRIDKTTSDGQKWEDRWGEWGGGLAGVGVMLTDIDKSAPKFLNDAVKVGGKGVVDWMDDVGKQAQPVIDHILTPEVNPEPGIYLRW